MPTLQESILSASNDPVAYLRQKQFLDWYQNWARMIGIDQNPYDPAHRYNYEAAYRMGASPGPTTNQIDPRFELFHWPSPYKAEDHPNRYVNGMDTITGQRIR